jgi:hypothetical protein
MSSTPATRPPARVHGRQVTRYYQLLVRLGIDRLFEAATKPAAPPVVGVPVSAADQAQAPAAAQAIEDVLGTLDIGLIIRACAGADGGVGSGGLSAIADLAAAVLDLSDADATAGEWYVDELEEAWPGFSTASAAPTRMLLRFGAGSA